MISLSLVAESRKAGPIELDLTNPEKLKDLKKNRGCRSQSYSQVEQFSDHPFSLPQPSSSR